MGCENDDEVKADCRANSLDTEPAGIWRVALRCNSSKCGEGA